MQRKFMNTQKNTINSTRKPIMVQKSTDQQIETLNQNIFQTSKPWFILLPPTPSGCRSCQIPAASLLAEKAGRASPTTSLSFRRISPGRSIVSSNFHWRSGVVGLLRLLPPVNAALRIRRRRRRLVILSGVILEGTEGCSFRVCAGARLRAGSSIIISSRHWPRSRRTRVKVGRARARRGSWDLVLGYMTRRGKPNK